MKIEDQEYKGYTIEIHQDDLAPDPREEFDNFSTMVTVGGRYTLGGPDDLRLSVSGIMDMQTRLEKEGAIILPIYLYDHGGVSIDTRSFVGRAQHAEWDSGQVGFVYATREQVFKEFGGKIMTQTVRTKAENLLRAEVKEYDQYLRGEVYGYNILDRAGEDLEYGSCWGFFGDTKDMLDEAKAIIDAAIKEPMTSAEYVSKKGVQCPVCRDTDIEGGPIEIDAGRAYQDIRCMVCGAYWTDTYELTGYQDLHKEDK